jgi:dTDP-4-dehydrorhamnose reductase
VSRWLVTGSTGMLGQDVVKALAEHGQECLALTRADLDITDAGAARRAVAELAPDVIVNCAAWTAVDAAESNADEAMRVNGDGPRHLAAACRDLDGTRLVHVSTDYVFAGDAVTPYPEDAPTGPCSVYGHSKLAGERAMREILPPERAIIVRTAWLYGAHGGNFVKTMIRLAGERPTVEVVTAQRGQPTWTGDLAEKLILLGGQPSASGVYHGTSAGVATWFDLAREVFSLLGTDPARVRPIGALPRPAQRPAYGVLGHDRWAGTGIPPIRDWRAALAAAFPSLHS